MVKCLHIRFIFIVSEEVYLGCHPVEIYRKIDQLLTTIKKLPNIDIQINCSLHANTYLTFCNF